MSLNLVVQRAMCRKLSYFSPANNFPHIKMKNALLNERKFPYIRVQMLAFLNTKHVAPES